VLNVISEEGGGAQRKKTDQKSTRFRAVKRGKRGKGNVFAIALSKEKRRPR